jgi:anti-anti-sigma factor
VTAETTCRFEELDRGVLAVTLRPELNEVPWTDIERIGSGIVGRIASQARPRVIVDLTELNHMGSAMVALVVRIWKATTEQNGRMIVVNRSDLVGEVLQISGLANKWTIVPSRDEALREFGAGRGSSSATDASDRLGVVLVALAGVLLVVGGLGIADAAASGAVSSSIGRTTTLWAATACSIVALILAAVAILRTANNLKLIAVVVTTLAAVAAIAGVGLALSPRAPQPAVDSAFVPSPGTAKV